MQELGFRGKYMEIKTGSLEERILKILLKKYPVTVNEIQEEVGVNEYMIERALKALQTKGAIMLDVLPDETFVRLINPNLHFVGRSSVQKKSLKRKTGKRKTESKVNRMMYA